MSQPSRYLAVLLMMGVGWGMTQPLGKLAVSTGHQHFGLIFWQMVVGALVLAPFAFWGGRRIVLTAAALRFALVVAIIGTIIPNSTFYYSVAHLPAGVMSILISMVPLLSFPIALALGMDRFSAARLLGLLLGLTGVALIALPSGSLPDAAMVGWLPVALIGPLFYAIEGNFVARNGMAGMEAVQAMFLVSVLGAVIVGPLALATGQFIDPRPPWGVAEAALVAASIVHSFAYSAYVWLAARAGAVFAAQTSYIVTGTGVVWAMVLLDERFSAWVWAALVVMLLGLFLVQPRGRDAAQV